MHLGHIGKNGPKTHYGVKLAISRLVKEAESNFCDKKITFSPLCMCKNALIYELRAFGSFLAHFWPIFANWPSCIFLNLAREQKVNCFHKKRLLIF